MSMIHGVKDIVIQKQSNKRCHCQKNWGIKPEEVAKLRGDQKTSIINHLIQKGHLVGTKEIETSIISKRAMERIGLESTCLNFMKFVLAKLFNSY